MLLPISGFWFVQAQQPHNGNYTYLTGNDYLEHLSRYKTPKVLELRARGGRCFDFEYYRGANPDLQYVGTSKEALWRHYVYYGQFEIRDHK